MSEKVQKPDACCNCGDYVNLSIFWCAICEDNFCDGCWKKERGHKSRDGSEYSGPHEKIEIEAFRRLNAIFDQPSKEKQKELYNLDSNTSWFEFRNNNKTTNPYLHDTTRLIDLLYESEQGTFRERFPHLVSFVGRTGAGKSTIIKMLMHTEQVKADTIDNCPVPGLLDDSIPTTGDVHLYADPLTYHTQTPILYADSEGMSGGERLPRALESQAQEAAEGMAKVRNIIKDKLKTISWANDPEKRSREFAVKHLFPRILYTFSDVIVFIFREIKTFESEVFQLLINWAATSIDKSLNQPSKPHVIIVLNDAKATGDRNQWDPDSATKKLFNDHTKTFQQNAPRGIKKPEDLLRYYYSSITVLNVPDKILLAKLNTQMQTLYQLIEKKCEQSHIAKRQTRMLLNTEKLPIYINAALHHFRRCLDEPFNFVTEARRQQSPPQDFGGHILNFILLMYNQLDNSTKGAKKAVDCDPVFFERLTDPIASCVMLAALRDNTQGTYASLFESIYKNVLWYAILEFQEKWLRCSFKDGGSECANVRSLHKKGHQSHDGTILGQGDHQSKLDQGFFGHWIGSIQKRIEKEEETHRHEEESSSIRKTHSRNMETLYKNISPDVALQNYLTCACCIGRTPEHALPCGHIICTACVQFFGTRIEPGCYSFTCCPLHPDQNKWPSPAQVRYKPEEAGVRVLCLDGGGVRGIVELVILHEIEKALGGHVPIQNFFDLIVGTSAGGMIALGLGIKNLRIDDCLSRFKALCQKSFVKRGVIKHAPVQNIARFLKSLFVMSGKSIYRSKPFEKALREVFDENSFLYNRPQPGNSAATRVAVTTTLAREDKAAILTNYNIERKSAKLPCLFIRPKTLEDEIKVWEAARATSAAPPYFKPFTHQKTGRTYIDGAIHHHCPVFIAEQERRLLWEDVQDSLPDITLSIGSGITKQDAYPSETNNANGLHGQESQSKRPVKGIGYLVRIASRIIERQLNCEAIWREYCAQSNSANTPNHLEDDCRRVRLNAEFADAKLSLDDVESIDMLEKVARNTIQQNQNEVQKVAEKLIASCFYFETTSPAKRDRGEKKYQCSGRIRCRFYEDTPNLKGLGEILLKYYTGTFAPHFVIQNDDEPNFTAKLELPKSVIEAMAEGSLANLPQNIVIRAPDQSSQTSISLYLYEADSYQYGVRRPPNISGFPRRLYTHGSSSLSEASGRDGYEPSQAQKDVDSQSEASSSSRPTSGRTE